MAGKHTKHGRNPIGIPDEPSAHCGAKRKRRVTEPEGDYYCQLAAGFGTNHVGLGSCKYHGGSTPAHVESARVESIRQHVATYGLPVRTTPTDALLEEVYRTAGHVKFLEQVIADLDSQDDLKQLTIDKGILWEKPSVWVELYHIERKHLVSVCATAIKCGIAERLVHIAEQQGAMIVQAVRGILNDHGITSPDLQIVGRHLRAITAQDTEETA